MHGYGERSFIITRQFVNCTKIKMCNLRQKKRCTMKISIDIRMFDNFFVKDNDSGFLNSSILKIKPVFLAADDLYN